MPIINIPFKGKRVVVLSHTKRFLKRVFLWFCKWEAKSCFQEQQEHRRHLLARPKEGDQFWVEIYYHRVTITQGNYSRLTGFKINGC